MRMSIGYLGPLVSADSTDYVDRKANFLICIMPSDFKGTNHKGRRGI